MKIVGVDSRGLNQAIKVAAAFSGRTAGQMAGTAAYFISARTQAGVRRANMGEMDQHLGVTAITPKLATRGKRKGLPLARGGKTYNLAANSNAELITLARLWPGTEYNKLTNSRWLIDRMTFSPGEGRAGFFAKINQAAQRMVGRRRATVSFLSSSLVPLLEYLNDKIDARYRRQAPSPDTQAEAVTRRSPAPLGQGTLTQNGYHAVFQGDLLIGTYASKLDKNQNKAMWRYVAPILQREIYNEEAAQMAYAAAKQGLRDRSGDFIGAGVKVS